MLIIHYDKEKPAQIVRSHTTSCVKCCDKDIDYVYRETGIECPKEYLECRCRNCGCEYLIETADEYSEPIGKESAKQKEKKEMDDLKTKINKCKKI